MKSDGRWWWGGVDKVVVMVGLHIPKCEPEEGAKA
jgi:hypothetical protein